MPDETVETLAAVWASIADLCAGFDDRDWERETACPGWDVKDQLAHLVGPETAFLGRPQPAPLDVPPPWVRNEIGKANEAAVAYRKAWSGADVLAEFVEVTGERVEQLRAMSEEDLAEDSWTPLGPGTVRDLLAVRAFDAWVHEQDIREAVHRPGGLDGPPAAAALGRCLMAMPYVVGKKAAAPEGATVVFEITGAQRATLPIGVSGGRARRLEEAPAEPTARLTIDFLPFTRLGCGRADPDTALAVGSVAVAGDRALGEAVARNLAFMI